MWSSSFVATLDSPARAPVVYVLPLVTDSGFGDATYSLGSVGGIAADDTATLVGLATVRQQLQTRTWLVTLGGFSFRVLPVPGGDVSKFLTACPRGTILGLYVGLQGVTIPINMESSPLSRVGVGIVVAVDPVYDGRAFVGLHVTCVDLPRSTRSRLVAGSGNAPLFYTTSSTALLTVAAAVADGTYTVNSSANFGKRTGTYPYGAFLVETSIGTSYWRLWSASTATTFTIQAPATASLMGTTDIGASTDRIREAWYLTGHPLDIVREILASTDAGGNGTYDILPAGWGIAVTDALIDHDDIDAYRASAMLTPSSGSYIWQIASTDYVSDAWSWMTGWLSEAGYYLCMRQGSITVRPGQSLDGDPLNTGIEISDDDIMAVRGAEMWAASHDVEYYNSRVISVAATNNSYSSTQTSLPSGDWYGYDVSDRLWANETVITAMTNTRLRLAVQAIPEKVSITCVGLRLAVLSLGDIVTLDTRQVVSRLRGLTGYLSDRAMVVGHAVDWMGGTVDVDLELYPVSQAT